MGEYAIEIARSARKEIFESSSGDHATSAVKIDQLAITPRPHGCIKLRGAPNRWRIRIGDYRNIYSVGDSRRIIDISAVRHRREAYE